MKVMAGLLVVFCSLGLLAVTVLSYHIEPSRVCTSQAALVDAQRKVIDEQKKAMDAQGRLIDVQRQLIKAYRRQVGP